ncbi:MAG: polysulfide reductase NrfD [Chloroflexota bacterium]|nr:polysulfide reductase NrfD [Chloroflexota bacterium]
MTVKLGKSLYFGALVVLTVLGLAALGYRLAVGMRVTALTSYVSWGLWVAFYIYFIGLSAGSFLLSTMIYVFNMRSLEKVGRMALLSAFFALGAGLLFVWMDLGHPYRFWEIYSTPHFTSVMTIESWLYILYMVLIAFELWFLMREDLAAAVRDRGARAAVSRFLTFGYRPAADPQQHQSQQQRAGAWVKALGIIGIPTAIGVHGGTGAIFAVAIARPYWNGGLFPIVFLVSALASGAALVTFLHAAFGRRDPDFHQVLRSAGTLMVLLIALDLLLLASEVLTSLYGGIPADANVFQSMFGGQYAWVFWLGQLGFGAAVPFLLVGLPATGRSPFWLGAAGLSTVLGIFAVRLNIVIPGFVVPLLGGLPTAYVDPRLTYQYFPSLWEYASSVGVLALVVLVFSLFWGWLPLFSTERPALTPAGH